MIILAYIETTWTSLLTQVHSHIRCLIIIKKLKDNLQKRTAQGDFKKSIVNSTRKTLSDIYSLPIQFPKAGQWWSSPTMYALQLLQYFILLPKTEPCNWKQYWRHNHIAEKPQSKKQLELLKKKVTNMITELWCSLSLKRKMKQKWLPWSGIHDTSHLLRFPLPAQLNKEGHYVCRIITLVNWIQFSYLIMSFNFSN